MVDWIDPLTPTLPYGYTAIKHPVPEQVKPSFVIFERQSARMSKITNDDLTRPGTGTDSFTRYENSGRQRVKSLVQSSSL